MTSAPRLRLLLMPSRRLAAGIVCAHGVAGLCAGLPWTAPLATATIFLLFLLLGAVIARRVALLRAARSPAIVELAPDGRFEVTLRNGTRVEGPAGRRHVTRYWVALRCGTPPGGAMLVVPDMLSPDAFRRLRLWALWSGMPGDPGTAPA